MATPRPVLIIDDEAAVRDTLLDQLAIDGEFTPVAAESAAAADRLLALEESRFDAILLDIGLTDCDGREYCARLRKAGVWVPIIMLTGAGAEQDVVRGLDSGANDYIAKPFRVSELMARLRAQLRHCRLARAVAPCVDVVLDDAQDGLAQGGLRHGGEAVEEAIALTEHDGRAHDGGVWVDRPDLDLGLGLGAGVLCG